MPVVLASEGVAVVSFSSLISAMDGRISKLFSDQTAVFHYHSSGATSNPVNVIVKNPVMEEGYIPGSTTPGQSVGVLILWFRAVDTLGLPIPQPSRGDVVTYGVGDYDIVNDPYVDREGGVTVKVRLRTQRFDQ